MVRRVLHIGPSETRGGMGSSIRRMCKNPPEGWQADSIPTHADGNILNILNAWRIGRRKFTRSIRENVPDIIHIHTATRFSWLRKRSCIHIAQRSGYPRLYIYTQVTLIDSQNLGSVGLREVSAKNYNEIQYTLLC